MRVKRNLVPIILLLLCACATLTPQQRVLWGLDVYLWEYSQYLDLSINPKLDVETREYLKNNPAEIRGDYLNPSLTEEQKKMLRVKKEILIELKPLVLAAEEYQRTGVMPADEITEKLTELTNRLVELGD